MRLVSYFVACSVDGFIAGPKGEIDWLFTDQDYGYAAFYESVDVIIMGMRTYQQLLTFKEWPYPNKKCYVATRQNPTADPRVEFTNDPITLIKKLKLQKGGKIWLLGGGQLAGLIANQNLINELILFIHPTYLGAGITLFSGVEKPLHLTLKSSKEFNTGLVQLTYGVRED